MPTVEEILKQSGFTEEQIKALEPKAITAFSNVLSTAQAEREANATFYDTQIVPSLTNWEAEKQRMDSRAAQVEAENAFYKTRDQQLRASGVIGDDVPGYPNRDQQGRYVSNMPGATPGSPTLFDVNKVYERAGDAVSVLTDVQWEHQRLFGQPLPISPGELVKQADMHHMDPRAFAARQFGWDNKRQELAAAEQKKHDDTIRADERRIVSEKLGSNPDIRQPMDTRFSDIQRARAANLIPDPLSMNEEQRRQATRQMIRKDMQDQDSQGA
jgi:hypothetical protein